LKNWRKANVKPLLEVRDDLKSSRCAVGIFKKKERCLVPEINASTKLSMDFVMENIDTINKSSLLVIEGYFVIEKYDIVLMLAKHFNEINKKICFTLSATFMIEFSYDKMLEIANKANIIFCNNEEATAFTKTNNTNMEEVALQIHQMLAPLERILVITCGKNPVVISKYDYKQKSLNYLLKSFVYPVESNEIVDTNGCGDSWVGGFLSQYALGRPLEECARVGNFASSVIIKQVGCTYPTDLDISSLP